MDHHDFSESNKVVQSEYVVQRGGGMTAHVAYNHCFWLESMDDCSSHKLDLKNESTYRLVLALRIAREYSVGLRRSL